ncbi:hypothetical protein RRG08_042639 [Elysia crispata]|uniref:Uncharacterized protein n=1 Tax=Elysia crispata TaxID=231223 RepID=A0AAE1CKE6_9GAST|nr:hypothetical protein RRG08_042639 [Elysia crispata]
MRSQTHAQELERKDSEVKVPDHSCSWYPSCCCRHHLTQTICATKSFELSTQLTKVCPKCVFELVPHSSMTKAISEMRMRYQPHNRIVPTQLNAPPTPPMQPQYPFHSTTRLLRNWGVHHRFSSAASHHSNSRAEIGVKTIKRMIMDNTSRDGSLDPDSFQHAILQYSNTPDKNTRLSPAICIFERPITDFIPIHPGKYVPHKTWQETWTNREEALRKRRIKDAEILSTHTRILPPLTFGEYKKNSSCVYVLIILSLLVKLTAVR